MGGPRHIRRRFALVIFAAGGLFIGVAPAVGAEPASTSISFCPTEGSFPAETTPGPVLQRYFKDDWRFGPKRFPDEGPIGRMLDDYRRFNGLGRNVFLDCYWHTGFAPGWYFPNDDGFLVIHGEPVMFDDTLDVGEKVDLFGSGQGRFLAPAGTPYKNRAIPPTNLNTFTTDFTFNYHKYRVTAQFTVSAGPIAPWFGQPGLGLQYFTGTTTAPNLPANPRIPDLVGNGYLVELT